MCGTCKYVENMPKMIQVRNVPDSLHRRLKSKAALEGLSLSDFLLREMEHVAERPTMKEIAERLARLPPVKYKRSPAEIIREERDSR
jgi:antitoxin FitA